MASSSTRTAPQLRKRRSASYEEEEEVYVASRKSLASAVKALDAYSNSKVATEFCASTSEASKKLSLGGYCVMCVLLLSEFWTYVTVEERDHMKVDTSLGKRLNISLNLSFPSLSCDRVHLDAMDVAGDYHPYMEQHIRKQRLTARGEAIDHEPLIESGSVYGSGPCESCFGAESEEIKCCNTCDDLMRAYAAKGWSTGSVRASAPQCASAARRQTKRQTKRQSRRSDESSQEDSEEEEGCNLAGWLDVNKVGGNFHVALGESTVRDGRFIHQFNPSEAPEYNVSHVVHDLSFGQAYPGMASPLKGVKKVCVGSTGLFQYFIKLVPTSYKGGTKGPVETTRYSFTQRFRPLKLEDRPVAADLDHPQTTIPHPEASLSSGSKYHDDHHKHAKAHAATALLPGVFFVYDVSAFMVQVTRHRPPLSHFLVRVCAVVGGCTTLVAFLARILGV